MPGISSLSSFLKRTISSGAAQAGPLSMARSIQLTNAIALIIGSLFFLLVNYLVIRNGWTTVASIGYVTIAALASVILLNHFRLYNFSRGLLCVIVPLAVVSAIFLPRIGLTGQYNYFRSADVFSILLAGSIIPLLIFSLRERRAICIGLLFNVGVLLLFDFALYHYSNANALAPYTLIRFISASVVILLMFLFLAGSITYLRDLFEYFESKNNRLIGQLNQTNTELHQSNLDLYELNQNIETQNEEIKSQSEALLQSQQSLQQANIEIEHQKRELEQKNRLLEETLGEKDFDLLQTNQQLINQNSELQQFSFTVSHNLRSPVASMQGLINLYRLSKTEEERKHIIELLGESSNSLETIIRDLGKIIEIRHDNFTALEKVLLKTEIDLITQSLHTFIVSNEVTIETDFSWTELVSIKAYINSILFNLVSNAIQYRSPNKKPIIRISSRENADQLILEVSDNGIGIDLKTHRLDLFKLYKRFHTHTPGKGLGLFIVKQQVEKLNGRIEVESSPGDGTTFRIFHQRNLTAKIE